MNKRGINQVRDEAWQAFARGDRELGRKLEAEYHRLLKQPRKRSVPISIEAKTRRRAFAKLWG